MTEPIVARHHTATAYVVASGRTLLLWHARLGTWLPPGGHSELNEDPVETALREAFEESLLEVEVIVPPDLLVCPGPRVLPPQPHQVKRDAGNQDDVRIQFAGERIAHQTEQRQSKGET